MDWLQDIGLETRRGLARAAKHTGGLLDHVGSAVDSVAHTADTLLPMNYGQVESELCPGGEHDAMRQAQRRDESLRATEGVDVPHAAKGLSTVPASSLRNFERRMRGVEGSEEETVSYKEADECDAGKEEAAPMSRGLLGLGMHKSAR
jgi:hypothetical protein